MSLKKSAEKVRRAGRGPDTELVHFTRREVAGLDALAKSMGGELTRNPKTGLPEAGFLDSLLPTILGATANFFVPGSGMIVGGLTGAMQNKNDPLMGALLGGMGGYGGGQLVQGLQGAGIGGAQAAAQGAQAAMPEAAIGQGLQASTLPPGLGLNPAVAPSITENATQGLMNQAAADASKAFMDKPFYEQMGAGIQAAWDNPSSFVDGLGGTVPAAKTAGMAAAPALYEYMQPKQDDGIPREDAEGRPYSYDAGYTGGQMVGEDPSSERLWFNPTFTPRFAEGGETPPAQPAAKAPVSIFSPEGRQSLMQAMFRSPGHNFKMGNSGSNRLAGLGALSFSRQPTNPKFSYDQATNTYTRLAGGGIVQAFANGGEVQLSEGGFVIPADVVSMIGNGSSSAGLETLGTMLGAVPLDGQGDGMSDDIPASIDGHAPARVARQEAYLPPERVQRLGGAKKLYSVLERVRQQAHGKTEQQRPVDLRKAFA